MLLVNVLGRDTVCLDAIVQIRAGEPPDRFAARYARPGGRDGGRALVGRPRRFMRVFLERAADADRSPQLAIFGLGVTATWTTAALTDDDPRQWPHAKRWPEAAVMLARLGADQCIRCGFNLKSGWSLRYCSTCEPQRFTSTGHSLGDRARSDRETISGLLHAAAAAALRVD